MCDAFLNLLLFAQRIVNIYTQNIADSEDISCFIFRNTNQARRRIPHRNYIELTSGDHIIHEYTYTARLDLKNKILKIAVFIFFIFVFLIRTSIVAMMVRPPSEQAIV